MKIGIDVRKAQDYGIGTYIRNVIFPAIDLDSKNEYVLFGDIEQQIQVGGRHIWINESSHKYSMHEHYSVARSASQAGVQLFHSPHYTLPMFLKCKSVVTIHDLIHIKFAEFFPAWKVAAAKWLLKRVIKKADAILTVSNTSRADILEYFPFAEPKVQTIYNRLSADWFEEPPAWKPESMGIEPEYILYAGNFKKHKGINTLIEAYSLLKNPPQLVLAGRPAGAEPELIDRIFMLPKVRVLGFAEGKLLHQLFAGAMLFVFPSLYEGFGYPPLEAMCAGTPVLSSDAPALREILDGSVEFFERGNVELLRSKLEMLIQDNQRRMELRKAGRDHALQFTGDRSSKELLQVYQRLLK